VEHTRGQKSLRVFMAQRKKYTLLPASHSVFGETNFSQKETVVGGKRKKRRWASAAPAPTPFSPNVELLKFVNDNRPWTLEAFALAFVPPYLLLILHFAWVHK
jgi:hypothetical protein